MSYICFWQGLFPGWNITEVSTWTGAIKAATYKVLSVLCTLKKSAPRFPNVMLKISMLKISIQNKSIRFALIYIFCMCTHAHGQSRKGPKDHKSSSWMRENLFFVAFWFCKKVQLYFYNHKLITCFSHYIVCINRRANTVSWFSIYVHY